jgi:hypothetical protein
MVEPGETSLPRLLVTGEIIEMHLNAASNFLSTHVTTNVILLVEERDQSTGKRSRSSLTRADFRDVFWFDPADAEALLRHSLTEAFRQWSPGMHRDGQMVGSRSEMP